MVTDTLITLLVVLASFGFAGWTGLRRRRLVPMSSTFERPTSARPYTGVGAFKHEPLVLSLMTRMRVVVRPTSTETAAPLGAEVPPDFEPTFRQAVAEALIGVAGGGFEVVYCGVEQFEDAGG